MTPRQLEARIALVLLAVWLVVVIGRATSDPWAGTPLYDRAVLGVSDFASAVIVAVGLVLLVQRSMVFRR